MKTSKLVLIVAVTLAGLSFSAAAQQGSKSLKPMSPRAVVVGLYKQHKKRSPFFQTRSRALLDRFFTRELANLIWNDAHSSGGEVGALDGDPLFNAQDMEITNFSVRDGAVRGGQAQVVVSFENLGQKHEITFMLIITRAGWRVSDLKYDDGSTLSGIFSTDAASIFSTDAASTEAAGQAIQIYLVAVGDDGNTGKKIGCGDSLIPVTRTIKKTAAPLTPALQELLSMPQHPNDNPKLENFWKGRNLKIQSVSIRGNTATIHISGAVFVAGACDIPRIESQIEETAQQFPNVKKVNVFIGKRTLADALR
jgi:hypothetical protein